MSRFICSTGTRVFHAVNDTEAAERRPNALRRRRGIKVTSSLAGYHRWTATAATPTPLPDQCLETWARTKVWCSWKEPPPPHEKQRTGEEDTSFIWPFTENPRICTVIFRWSIIVHIALRCLFSFLNTRRPSNKLFTVLTVRLFHPGWTPCWEPLCSRHVKLSLELEAISWCQPHISKANTEKKPLTESQPQSWTHHPRRRRQHQDVFPP